jgi:carbamoyltransferase
MDLACPSNGEAMARAESPRVLGFSGLAHARTFKRRLPGLTDREQAIFQGADAAAALVVGGKVVSAAAEERFNGQKHSEAFPVGAAEFCLETAGLGPADLDCVAHSFSFAGEKDFYHGISDFYRGMYDEVLAPEVNRASAESALGVELSDRYLAVPHHLCHAASAYAPSGFSDALVLVSDGLGERHSATVLIGSDAGGEEFETLVQIPAHCSLGLLYGLFTLYLGFRINDGEYKVMGLAPYGNPSTFAHTIMDNWVSLGPDGRYSLSILLDNSTDFDKETYRPALSALERVLGPAREAGAPIESRHADVAAGLQAVVQGAQLHLLGHAQAETGLRQLAIAGGVGLNCVANGVLQRSGMFDDIYVQPAAGDDGAALGAALYACSALGGRPIRSSTRSPLLGPGYDRDECKRAATSVTGATIRSFDDEAELVGEVAGLLEQGKIIGWFQGRMEFGPRALGNRSILADPRQPNIKDQINARVKKRESFRPFAPAVLEEHAHEWFEIEPDQAHRFADMQIVAFVRDEHRGAMPAVTHVDGSARVQTVARERNGIFWSLLRAFGERTGFPLLLNTSFNVAGQPIVRTPGEAISTFLDAGLDALVMDRLLILPEDGPSSAR